ncbi:hypothetical protein COCC4DRAFT_143586 [Bipolaris maydis ATCC 48331]|uniref:Uncharacterized protein n=2 Tax=Cochliobolus heterostrophus TaxID=5016 RepID=M2TY89_COCH5|nr:uncharacterized protein COCC4DRAFT_143586 [Bipolaris maydis ATCC 48331]EMD86761.1 hypothetical protein COCHEDRAFT_1034527 [Bipolaris maydis C5]KAJ6192205.1 hypothetical protein J3E72DRAFT_273560 [Bipolaris maydis]ENI03154.1 hypothetical protein COCC4DRAFT_143586 [Bipolaris maydis ATCC 48331]KAJ6203665.1 hypothetical protein PSV09DRAFT_1034527 [Bipolaris maydis]KAJ6267330.1 hypothetical protein PSV08DRAFT_186399 [Bipolaris maydis]
MKHTIVLCSLLIALSNAQLTTHSGNAPKRLELPPELESLIKSVELQASSVVDSLQSVYSEAATAAPTALLTGISGLLPTHTPNPAAESSQPVSQKIPYFSMTIGLVIATAVCCALG